jgi:hypothetical protein
MSFPLYKDITKNANDLLKKGYVTTEKYAFRVDFDTTTASGTQLTPYLQRTLDNNVEGELKVKCNFKDHTITSTENTKQDISLEISPSKNLPSGLKWALNASSNVTELVEKSKLKATLELKNDFSNTSLSFEHPIRQPVSQKPAEGKATLNSVFGSKEKGFALGFDTELSLATYSLNSLNTTLAINKPDIDFALFSKKKFGSANNLIVGVNYFQKLTTSRWTDTQVASEVSYDLNEKSSAFALGLSFKPSEASSVKTRYDSKGLLGFLYTDKWNGPLTVAFGADWNILGGAGLQHSIKLTFK